MTGTSLRKDQHDTEINYIRNSVKATVDAYTGKVTLYAWDAKDPILKAWRKIFPGIVSPKSAMPADVLAHVRYPQDLFNVQRGLLAQYHISNPVQSYNGTGKWAVPADPFDSAAGDQPAYYVLANSPNAPDAANTQNTPQFQLTTPMVVNNSTNLAAYISVDSDPGPDYGKLTVLTMPTKQTIQGPSIIANDFKSEAIISKDIQQLDNGQSRVIHGNLLTLPLGGSFLYVEPLYVQSASGTTAFPTLQRVLVRYGGSQHSVGYGSTLADALADIQDNRTAGASLNIGQTTTAPNGGSGSKTPSSSASPTSPAGPSTTPTTPPAAGTSGSPTSVPQAIVQLDQATTQLNAAKRSGDLVKIAQAQQRIDDLVAQLTRLQSSATAKPRR